MTQCRTDDPHIGGGYGPPTPTQLLHRRRRRFATRLTSISGLCKGSNPTLSVPHPLISKGLLSKRRNDARDLGAALGGYGPSFQPKRHFQPLAVLSESQSTSSPQAGKFDESAVTQETQVSKKIFSGIGSQDIDSSALDQKGSFSRAGSSADNRPLPDYGG
jgi:hypothetical protein